MIYSAEDRTCWHCRRALQPVDQAFGPLPGPGWEELFTSSAGNLTLYRLGPTVLWPIPTRRRRPATATRPTRQRGRAHRSTPDGSPGS